MIFDAHMLARYFVLGTQDVRDEAKFFEVLTAALQSGITLFQYREKGPGALIGTDKLRVAQKVRALTHQYHVPLVIDDDITLAHAVQADGVHFGQGDGAPEKNIQQAGALFVGVSVSTPQEYARIADLSGIDHIGIGPVYLTHSKADAKPAIGTAGLQAIAEMSRWPSVAIGGITLENLAAVLNTDVAGAAVISMISQSDDIAQTLQFWQTLSTKKEP
ncbi:thiamine phosphate synthase [Leuconostoc holzapfelii]|uniref:Thiamine-phosphate synthase n=1 Tax=Leuconostoc holzapfelii TaxID=434464 RepID=A0ABT2NUE0_9LACO|nr:thiamine phosphate synthase [Leuconostoc holzapfelii]MCT8388772.1 thiamine phosphate synthase [Leuconostoc holzapfelii]